MEKKIVAARVQPYLSQSSPHPATAKFNSASNIQHLNSNFQSESGRSKAKGKSNTYNSDFNNGRTKFSPANRGGNGYQRRSSQNQQNHEMREGSVGDVDQSCHTRRSGNEKSSRHGASAAHLLNFTYTPLRSQEDGGFGSKSGYRREGRARRVPVHTKEQFLQAHCQFVVKETLLEADYAQCLDDPDKMIEWEHIEQVILNDEQISSCPICLEVPIAAKITKCAHVYCWPCILHYLSLTDRKWAKCPICFDSIEEKDLKSVVTKALGKYRVGDEVTFQLMKRERGALYARPKPLWKATGAGHLFSLAGDVEDVRYSKLLSVAAADIETIVNKERRQLLSLLEQEDTQSLEASFIEAALNVLSERTKVLGFVRKPSALAETAITESPPPVDQEVEAPVIRSVRSDPKLKAVSYADAFGDEAAEEGEEDVAGVVDSSVAEHSGPAESPQTESVTAVVGGTPAPDQGTQRPVSRNRNESSTSSSDSGEAELLAADLVLPATGTQPGRSGGSKRSETYYYYQAADGQHVYLHSINTRILAAQYGSMEMCPQTLSATILESEEYSLTQDVRQRLKYLSHLPLYTQHAVCEVTLRPPIVSSKTLSHFSEVLNDRKRARNRRARTETKHSNRIQAEERRRMGQFPDMAVPLDSEREFPVGAAAIAPVAEPSLTAAPQEASAVDYSAPGRQHEVPLTTPYSFAQAMKGSSGAPAAVWPRVQTNYVRSSGPQLVSQSVGDEQEDEEGASAPAPTFRQSCRVDFEEVFSNISMDGKKKSEEKEEENPQGQRCKKGKDKKRKKQLVLFSTAGQRSNQ